MILNLQAQPLPQPWGGAAYVYVAPEPPILQAEDGSALLAEDGFTLLPE